MYAISINNLTFSYGSNLVLNNFNVQIKYNQIYALLGPSGGGKTTLFKIVLGLIRSNNGLVSVLGQMPGQVNRQISFMPQESGLCQQFTVQQTMNYFMNIYQISAEDFKKRYYSLRKLLKLPNGKLHVTQLSGGTQRRLSLAIALINNPRLVILDEPTVGIDAVLRIKIWEYLVNQCLEGMTVVIVTHYIEEAANANRVGLMRNGRILAEDNPNILIKTYKQNSLEEVFLKLCLVDDKSSQNFDNYKSELKSTTNDCLQFYDNEYDYDYKEDETDTDLLLKLWILLILVIKNLKNLFQMGIPLIIVLLPATQALIFCIVYYKESIKLTVAVYNEESVPGYGQQLFSSIVPYNRHLINPVNYSSLESALKAIEKNQAIGVVWIPNNFTDGVEDRLENIFDTENHTLIDSSIRVYTDNAIYMYGNGFLFSLRDTIFEFVSKLYKTKYNTEFQYSINVETSELSKNLILSDYYMPGFFIFYLYLSQITISSLTLIKERKNGLFERSLIAGVSRQLVFVSHFISNCILSSVQVLTLYLTAFEIFKITNHGSVYITLIFFMFVAINAISLGFLISSLLDREISCVILVWFLTIPELFTAGINWPLESIDRPFCYAFYLCPLTLPVETMRNIMLRGWGLDNINIKYGFMSAIIPSILYLFMAFILFKRK